MKNKSYRLKRGQSLIEWALILPILLMLIMFILDVGRGVYYYSNIYNGAREGARYGVIHPMDITGINERVQRLCYGMDLAALTINITAPDADHIRVNVLYQFSVVTPIGTMALGGDTITLNTTSTMLIER